jgi:hypothetical protein
MDIKIFWDLVSSNAGPKEEPGGGSPISSSEVQMGPPSVGNPAMIHVTYDYGRGEVAFDQGKWKPAAASFHGTFVNNRTGNVGYGISYGEHSYNGKPVYGTMDDAVLRAGDIILSFGTSNPVTECTLHESHAEPVSRDPFTHKIFYGDSFGLETGGLKIK